MKTKFTPLAALLTLAIAMPLASAQTTKESTTTETKTTEKKVAAPTATSITGIVRAGATFSVLAKALDAAGLSETLGSKGTYTVFAPTDDAFMKMPKGSLDKLLLPENKEKLRSLLLFHVIPGDFLSSALKDDSKVKSMSGDEISIDVDGKTIKAGDAKVVTADVKADNGTVHVVDHVMIPKSLDGFAGLDKD